MNKKQNEITRTIQVLLWIWFGLTSSFIATNVVNIAKLETEVSNFNNELHRLEKRFLLIKYSTTSK